MSDDRQKILVWVLRFFGFCSGCAVTILGIFDFINNGPVEFQQAILDIYRIIFGILIILAELRITYLLAWFSFLLYFIGMGAFDIFVGGLALGTDHAYEYVVTAVLCTIGILYCGVGCCCSGVEANTQSHVTDAALAQQAKIV